MLWLLALVPVAFAAAKLAPEAHTWLFVLSALAIVPLATIALLIPSAIPNVDSTAKPEFVQQLSVGLAALTSEIFVESVQQAAEDFGMTPAFVGFIVVAPVGGAAELASAFSGARKNRLDRVGGRGATRRFDPDR
jgi:Ca2+/H+ antiporter